MSEAGGVWLAVKERSAIAEARRQTRGLASAIGLSQDDAERAAIAVSEIATNMLKHAEGGRILVTQLEEAQSPTLVLLAADEGPGIENVDRAMIDGVSSAGSPGIGLGAIQRQADIFDLLTTTDEGTILIAQFHSPHAAGKLGTTRPAVEVASLILNYPGQSVCGDGRAMRHAPDATLLLLCDGLGHGPEAHRAAQAAIAAFRASSEASPARLIEEMSDAAADTRGAVALVCSIAHGEGAMTFSGIGNVSGLIASPRSIKRLPSKDGRLGASRVSVRDEEIAFAAGEVLLMHSDGIRTLRQLGQQPGLTFRHPLTIAGHVLARTARGNDDACVLAAKRSTGFGEFRD